MVSSLLSLLDAGRVRSGELTTFAQLLRQSSARVVEGVLLIALTPIELQARFWGQISWIKCRETGGSSD